MEALTSKQVIANAKTASAEYDGLLYRCLLYTSDAADE